MARCAVLCLVCASAALVAVLVVRLPGRALCHSCLRLGQRYAPEPSEVRPPGLILLTGLGASCSGGVAHQLGAAGVSAQSFNDGTLDAGSRKHSLVEFQKTINYDVGKLPSALRDEAVAEVDALLERFGCGQRACAFESESFLSLLPVYRFVLAEQRQQRLCVIHYVQDPVRWVLAHNWLAVPEYYSALLGETPLAEDITKRQRTAEGGRHDEAWITLKSSLWSRIEQEFVSWNRSTEHEPLIRNFWWRCGVDPLNGVLDAAMAACGGPRGSAAAGLAKEQGSSSEEGMVPMDPSSVRRWLPTIMNITHDTAKLLGLPRLSVQAAPVKAAPVRTNHNFRSSPSSRVLLYPRGKLAFCYVEKNACTQFNRLFNTMNHRKSLWFVSSMDTLRRRREDVSRESGWRWAVFLRDPLLRYLSAWGSKCVQKEDGSGNCLPKGMLSKLTVEGFEQNVRANFADPGPLARNPHWALQQDFCWGLGNASGYDFVGHVSGNVTAQVQEMLRMVGAEDQVHLVEAFFPSGGRHKGHTTHMQPSSFYRNRTIQQMVMQMYRDDFNLPGLRPTPIEPK